MGIAGSMLEAISMAIITGWIFLQLDGSLSGIRSREGALYTAASLRKTSFGFLPFLIETTFRVVENFGGAYSSCQPSHRTNMANHHNLYIRKGMLTRNVIRRISHSLV